jgi:hypothetical protein
VPFVKRSYSAFQWTYADSVISLVDICLLHCCVSLSIFVELGGARHGGFIGGASIFLDELFSII